MVYRSGIVLAGYYGYGNLGDELIKINILKSLEERYPGLPVTVLERKPGPEKKFYIKAERYSPPAVCRALKGSGVFILGGGSILQDSSGIFTLYYYLLLIVIAKLFRNRVALFNQGAGPIKNRFNYRLAGFILSFADIIIARDRDSLEFFKKLTRGKKIYLGADPVFYEAFPGKNGAKKNIKKKIGFSVRDWKKTGVKDKVRAAAGRLKNKYSIYNINFHRRRDILSCPSVKELEWAEPGDIWKIISCMDMIVGMRLHSLICAAVAGIPAAGIVYDPKVKSFCDYMGIPAVNAGETGPLKLEGLIRGNAGRPADYKDKAAGLRKRYIDSLGFLEKYLKRK